MPGIGIDQAKISLLMTGKLAGFSLERLFRFLNDLGQDVAINIKPKVKTREKGLTIVGSYKKTRSEICEKVPSKGSRSSVVYAKKRP